MRRRRAGHFIREKTHHESQTKVSSYGKIGLHRAGEGGEGTLAGQIRIWEDRLPKSQFWIRPTKETGFPKVIFFSRRPTA